VTDTLKNLLDIFHKAVVEDRLVELYMSEVTLTLAAFSTSLALLVQS